MCREIRALREVLPKESVRVFVGAASLGALRIAEIHQRVRRSREGLMVHRFHASILRQGLTQLVRQLPDVRVEGGHHGLSVPAGDFHEHRKPGVPLDERRDAGIATSGNAVVFPMPGNGSVLNLRGAWQSGLPSIIWPRRSPRILLCLD